jgi:undecaprenyl pyrophosphate phosphatase UppP
MKIGSLIASIIVPIVTTIVFWINIIIGSITTITIYIYDNSIIDWRFIGPLIIFVCSIICCICLFIEMWYDRFLKQKRLRDITEEQTEWWKLKKFGGWI